MLASYQDVFPTDFLPSVLKRSLSCLVASLVSLWDAENKSCLSSAQLALFPLFRVKGADVEPGWGSATGTAAILATVREKVCRKQWRTFTLIVQTLFHKNSTKHEMQREKLRYMRQTWL